MELLMNDGFDGEPAKRALQYIKSHQARNHPIVGIYCGYAPIELIQAMGIVPAVLCAFSNIPIEAVYPIFLVQQILKELEEELLQLVALY